MAEHSTLTGADLHECKGAATAAANTVLQADGAGSAQWNDIITPLKAANRLALTTRIPDISTPSSVFVVCPMAGDIISISVVLHGSITVADSIVTAEINGAGVSGISITITQAGSAAGSTFSGTPSGNNTLTANQAIEIITDGGSSTAVAAEVTILIDTE